MAGWTGCGQGGRSRRPADPGRGSANNARAPAGSLDGDAIIAVDDTGTPGVVVAVAIRLQPGCNQAATGRQPGG
jgi:hypothetical protein